MMGVARHHYSKHSENRGAPHQVLEQCRKKKSYHGHQSKRCYRVDCKHFGGKNRHRHKNDRFVLNENAQCFGCKLEKADLTGVVDFVWLSHH